MSGVVPASITEQLVQIKCKSSVSLIPNNLCVNSNYVAYAYRNQVAVASVSSFLASAVDPLKSSNFTRVQTANKEAVLQLYQAKLGNDDVLIVLDEGDVVQACESWTGGVSPPPALLRSSRSVVPPLTHSLSLSLSRSLSVSLSLSPPRQVLDESGARLLFSHKIVSGEKAKQSMGMVAPGGVLGDMALTSVAVDGHNRLYVGANTRQIHVLDYQAKKTPQLGVLDGHRAAVTAVACRGNYLASGDSRGQVVLWGTAPTQTSSLPSKLAEFTPPMAKRIAEFSASASTNVAGVEDAGSCGALAAAGAAAGAGAGAGEGAGVGEEKSGASAGKHADFLDGSDIGCSVTSMDVAGDLLVVGYSTGQVLLFDLPRRALVAEVAAHSRRINAVRCHSTLPLLAVAAEDGYVTAWALPSVSDARVRLLLCRSPDCGLLTGVAWVPAAGSVLAGTGVPGFDSKARATIAVSVYDSVNISLIPLASSP